MKIVFLSIVSIKDRVYLTPSTLHFAAYKYTACKYKWIYECRKLKKFCVYVFFLFLPLKNSQNFFDFPCVNLHIRSHNFCTLWSTWLCIENKKNVVELKFYKIYL